MLQKILSHGCENTGKYYTQSVLHKSITVWFRASAIITVDPTNLGYDMVKHLKPTSGHGNSLLPQVVPWMNN